MTGYNLALTMTDLKKELNELLAYYKSLKTDGWTMEEIYSFITRSVASIVRLVGEYSTSETDIKTTVMTAIDELYDNVIAPIDIPYVPNLIETRFVDPLIKAALKKQISGIIDGLLKVFDRPPTPNPEVTTPPPVEDGGEWKPY